jgi:hypothetical protein
MNIVYCFHKVGDEGIGWSNDIIEASNENYRFIPFNQEGYLDITEYWDAIKPCHLAFRKLPDFLVL